MNGKTSGPSCGYPESSYLSFSNEGYGHKESERGKSSRKGSLSFSRSSLSSVAVLVVGNTRNEKASKRDEEPLHSPYSSNYQRSCSAKKISLCVGVVTLVRVIIMVLKIRLEQQKKVYYMTCRIYPALTY